jgi:hypothetical protein
MQYRSMLMGLAFAAVTIIGAGAEPAASSGSVRNAAPAWTRTLAGTEMVLADSATTLAAGFVASPIPSELVPHLGLQVCAHSGRL